MYSLTGNIKQIYSRSFNFLSLYRSNAMSGTFEDVGPVSPKSKHPVRGPQVLPIPVEVSPCTNNREL